MQVDEYINAEIMTFVLIRRMGKVAKKMKQWITIVGIFICDK